MSLLSWLTGRDANYKYVAANPDKAVELSNNISKIGSADVASVKESVSAKISALNAVIANAGLELPTNAYDGVFDSITEQIEAISTQFTTNIEDIKTFDNAKGSEIILSTMAMAGAKFGEGVLSVGEDFGDGVLSLVGWIAPKDSKVEKWCTKAIEKNWSHDAFNFYYNSEFAKKSAFTEDSAIAGGFKLAGEVTTFLFVGGAMAGSASVASTSSRAIPKVAGKIFSSTTRANTFLAAQTGLGRGTESGIQSGKSIDEAVRTNGLKTATIDAALIYAGGKWSEHLQKSNAVKAAEKELDAAKSNFHTARAEKVKANEVLKSKQGKLAEAEGQLTDAQKAAQKLEDKIASGKYKSSKKIDAYRAKSDVRIAEAENRVKGLQKGVNDAEKALDASKSKVTDSVKQMRNAKDVLKSKKSATYQGYDDNITKLGQDVGKSTRQGLRSGRKALSAKVTETSAKRGAKKIASNEAKAEAARAEATKAEQTFNSATNKLNRNGNKIDDITEKLNKAQNDLKNKNYKSLPRQQEKIRRLKVNLNKAKKATPQLVKEKGTAEVAHKAAQTKLTRAEEVLKSSKNGAVDVGKAEKASQKAMNSFKNDVAAHPVTKAVGSAKAKVTGGAAKLKNAASTTKNYVSDTASIGKDALGKTVKAGKLSRAGSSKAVTMSGDAAAQRANFVDALKKPVNSATTSIKGKVANAGESLSAGFGKLKDINGATVMEKAGKGATVIKENAPRIVSDAAVIGVGVSKTDAVQNLIGGNSAGVINGQVKPTLHGTTSEAISKDVKQDYPGIPSNNDNSSNSSDDYYSNSDNYSGSNSSDYSGSNYSDSNSSSSSNNETENTDIKNGTEPSKEKVVEKTENTDIKEGTENTIENENINSEEKEAIDIATNETSNSESNVENVTNTTPEVTNTVQSNNNVPNTQNVSTQQVSYNNSPNSSYVEPESNVVSTDNSSNTVQNSDVNSVDNSVGVNEENVDQTVDDSIGISEEDTDQTIDVDTSMEEEKSHTTITSDSKLVNPKTSNSNGGSNVIPIIAGVGAAVAAGAGAKVYMDNKKNNDNESYDENWSNENEEEQNTMTDNSDAMIEDNNDNVVQNTEDLVEEQFDEPVKYNARTTEELSEKLGGYDG